MASLHEYEVYGITCIPSAILGFLGATTQVVSNYSECKDYMQRQRSGRRFMERNPLIIMCLAISNILSCIGVFVRSIATLSGGGKDLKHILEVFTEFGFIASVMWTLSFAINIFQKLNTTKNEISMMKLHMLAWSIPMACSVTHLVLIYKFKDNQCLRWYWNISMYTPMLVGVILIIILYWKACKIVSVVFMQLTSTFTKDERAVVKQFKLRFFWIIFFFIICWLPNIIDCILHISITKDRCKPTDRYVFPMFEAVLNPLQGLLNCFLYGNKYLTCRPCNINTRTRKNYITIPDSSISSSL